MSPKAASYLSEASISLKKGESHQETLRELSTEYPSLFSGAQAPYPFPTAPHIGWTLNTPLVFYALPIVQHNEVLDLSQGSHNADSTSSSSATSVPFDGQTGRGHCVMAAHRQSETVLRTNFTGGYRSPEQSNATFSEAHHPSQKSQNRLQNAAAMKSTTMKMPSPRTQHQGSKIGRMGSSVRPRSKSIAIKRNPVLYRVDDDDENYSESSFSEDQKAYDWATWRMYNRITQYRQKNPVSGNYYHSSECVCSTGLGQPTANENLMSSQRICPIPLRCSDYLLDGEIFELDDI